MEQKLTDGTQNLGIDHSHSSVAPMPRQTMEVVDSSVETLKDFEDGPREGSTLAALEESTEDDDQTATPTILSKFDALASQWSAAPSHQSNDDSPPATPKLIHRLADLHRTWSGGSPPKNERTIRPKHHRTPGSPSKHSVQSNESSLGRTTLSSHETTVFSKDGESHLILDERQAVFDRLYRNEKRYTPRVRQRNSPSPPRITRGTSSPTDHSVGSFCSTSLEKRLSYMPPGEVRRVRQAARLRESPAAPSPVHSSSTVYDRLYRKEPRTKNLIATPKQIRPPSHGSPSRSIQTDVRRQVPSTPGRLPTSAGTVRSDTAVKRPAVSQSSPAHTPISASHDVNTSHLSSRSSGTRRSVESQQSVFDRLYRNEPRPTPRATNRSSQRTHSTASQNVVAPSLTRAMKATTARPLEPSAPAAKEPHSVVASASSTQSRLQNTITQRTRRRAIQPTSTGDRAEDRPKKSHSSLSIETNEIMDCKPKTAATGITNDPSPATAAETLSAASSFSHTSPTSATTTGILTNYDDYPNTDIGYIDEQLQFDQRTRHRWRSDSGDGSWSARQEIQSLEVPVATTMQLRWNKSMINRRRDAAVLTIQSVYRGYLCRLLSKKQKKLWNLAATRIQSRWRGFSTRWQVAAERSRDEVVRRDLLCATKIQSLWRSYRSRLAMGLTRKRMAAIAIQTSWRSFIGRSMYLAGCRHRNAAVCTVQRCWRSLLTRRCQVQRDAALAVIQRFWKSHHLRSVYLEWSNNRRRSATRIQALWRSTIAVTFLRHGIAHAINIQRCWRGFGARIKFLQSIVAARRIALFASRSVRRRHMQELENRSAINIQTFWRSYRRRSAYSELCDHRRRSVVRIQSIWRSSVAVATLRQSIIGATKIQRYWRCFVVRSKEHKLIMFHTRSAMIIQACWKYFRMRVSFLIWYEARRTGAIRIQAMFRTKIVLAYFRHIRICATLIQMCWRSCDTRSKLYKSIAAASRIALFVRQYSVRHRLTKTQARSATALQAHWKSYRLRAAFLEWYNGRRMSAVRIQARWRSAKAVITFRKSKSKACMIQCYWRRFNARIKLHQLIEFRARSANIIVYYWRSYQVRSAFVAWTHHRSRSATCIQSTWRSLRMLSKLESALYLLRRSLHGRSSRQTALYPLLVINLIFRSSKIDRFLSLKQTGMWKCRKLEAMELAAVLIQCFVRGCLCRMELGSLPNVKRNNFFCMIPFKRRCEWTSTSTELIAENQDFKSTSETRMEATVAEVLIEQAELFSSFAATYLIVTGDDTPLMGTVSGFFGAPCLERLTQRVRLSASSFVGTFLLRTAFDSSNNSGQASGDQSRSILNSSTRSVD
jgi:IQ calmodulin-binding motif